MEDSARNNPEKVAAEIRLLYQDNLDNIRDLKRNQWLATNYAVLVYVALASATQLNSSWSVLVQYLLSGAGLIAGAAGALLVIKMQRSLGDRRTRISDMRNEYFADDSQDAYGQHKPGHTSFWRDWPMMALFMLVLTLGLVLLYWLIWT